ncbi:MAG TPA: 8-amino-7-oxononanoate synthase [Casimicrobiaceae bacterium]|nr:8-amino-7-oxononanoate synthase [Casimicrobiaceae bacterium]
MATALIAELERDLAKRRAEGLSRVRRLVDSAQGPRVVVDGRVMLAFASNDYLGLASDASIVNAAREGALRWGVGAGASHLVCGHQTPHAEVEAALASYVAPCADSRAILFSSGYLANLAILSALADRSTAIFADRLNHACLNDGALLSRAELVRYSHGDAAALRSRLERSPAKRKLIVTDAVFSMDGTIAPLLELAALAGEHDAWLVVDDAHGFGINGGGRGTLAQLRIGGDRVVVMGTLGKAAGVAGAFVVAHAAVIETIVQTARPYIYTTAQPALLACAIGAALAAIRAADDRRAHLFALVERFRAALVDSAFTLRNSPMPIQPLIVGDNTASVALSERLASQGILVPAIRPPTVPIGSARLRVSLSAAHSEAEVDALTHALLH